MLLMKDFDGSTTVIRTELSHVLSFLIVKLARGIRTYDKTRVNGWGLVVWVCWKIFCTCLDWTVSQWHAPNQPHFVMNASGITGASYAKHHHSTLDLK